MKEEEIRELLTEQGIDYAAHGSICATIKASVGAYKNGIGDIMHTMKDHILHINAQGIAILAIDDINGIPAADTLHLFPGNNFCLQIYATGCFFSFYNRNRTGMYSV